MPGSPSSFSTLTGPDAPRTDAATAALETPAPNTPTPTTPPGLDHRTPRTTLSSSKKTRVLEESGERARSSANRCGNGPGRASGEVDRTTVPAAPDWTEQAKAGAAAKVKTSSLGSHRLPPGVFRRRWCSSTRCRGGLHQLSSACNLDGGQCFVFRPVEQESSEGPVEQESSKSPVE